MSDDVMADNSRMIVSVTDYNKGDYTNYSGTFATFTKEQAKAVLADAGIASNAAEDAIAIVNVDLDGQDVNTLSAGDYAFTYDGNTYLLLGTNADEFGNKEVLVQLSGVQDADSLAGFVQVD